MHEADAARLAELLGDVRRLFKEKVTTWANSPGVPLTTVVMLREVARDPGVGVSILGRRTGFSKGYVSSTVEQMEEEGLLHKTAHPKDQRCLQIRLTQSGRELLDRLEGQYGAFWAELLHEVPDDEAAQIIAALEQLRARLTNEREDAGD